MNIAVIGTGYVGLVTGVVLAELGNNVICVDKDERKAKMLQEGIPPIYEPGVEELLKRGLKSGFLRISQSIEFATRQSEIIFIAVGTPPLPDGNPDLSAVRAVATEIGKNIFKRTIIVNKSTVPIGSGDMVEQIILSLGVPHELFDVVSNPEFLREGSAIYDTMNPDRVVIGAKNQQAAARLVELYAPLQAPMIITDLNSAELIKYGANAFLAMKISFINALSQICELCGANVGDVAKGMGADARIGKQFLQAGLGWGGSCFPKDVQGMIKTAEGLGYDFELLKEVVEINNQQVERFISRIENRIGGFKGKLVSLMGLAFKPNTDDIRDAKSLRIIEAVLEKGGRIRAYDPIAEENVRAVFPDIEYVQNLYELAEDADVLVLVTEWNEFRQIDLERLTACMKQPLLFDGRRLYNHALAERAGIEYYTIGA
ncbi:MAG: UDP-glucose/GDP-mannose dehydrogenase family protein [Fimbriimonas sp.]